MLPLEVSVRYLEDSEIESTFAIVRQLRDHLDLSSFVSCINRQKLHGYRLAVAIERGAIRGVIGMRPLHTLARGFHLHVDDLVVDAGHRGRGLGRALLDFALREAVRQGMSTIFLDSRREVLPFYEHLGFNVHTSLLMRRRLQLV